MLFVISISLFLSWFGRGRHIKYVLPVSGMQRLMGERHIRPLILPQDSGKCDCSHGDSLRLNHAINPSRYSKLEFSVS